MCSVRQANNVLLWTNFVRQKDSVLMLNIRLETCFFFVLFFFHGGILQICNPYYTHRHHYF